MPPQTNEIYQVLPNTPYTQGLRPLWFPSATTKLTRWPLTAERRLSSCLGCSRVVHRPFRDRHGWHGRRKVLSMFETVTQRSLRRSGAHRSLKGGRRKADTSSWSQKGCTVIGHWWPCKKMHTVVIIVYQFEWCFCLPFTTIVPPLADQ